MATISMRHAVSQAYGFLLGRPLTILGLTWMPAVFYAVSVDILFGRMSAAAPPASANAVQDPFALSYFAAFLAATALFGAIIATPLTQQALGLREERVAAYLVVGVREFRLFLELLRYYGVLAVALAVAAICAGVFITQAEHYADVHHFSGTWGGLSRESWLDGAAGGFGAALFVVLSIKYGFFLGPVAVAEQRATLFRANALTRGNFWKLAGVTLFISAPASLLLIAGEAAFGDTATSNAFGATLFASILAAGLVVLQALYAGASSAAYSEILETVQVHASAQIEAYEAPARASAESLAAPERASVEYTRAAVASAMPLDMKIATPEADGALSMDWMAPPPDAHFGSDPHDAQHIEDSDEAQTRAATKITAPAMAGPPLPAEIPEHAVNTEFPPPPLDPVGAMTVQAGLRSAA